MDYHKIYNQLISKARNEENTLTCYYEVHHIIPKSIGGTDSLSNLVKLPVRTHLIAHQLLVKMYRLTHPKLIYAVWAFFEDRNPNRKCLRERKGWLHGWLRRERSLVTAAIIRDMGHMKVIRWNAMNELQKRKHLSDEVDDD